MKIPLIRFLTRKTLLATQLILITLVTITVWIFNQFDLSSAFVSSRGMVQIEVSRFEVMLVLLVLFMNILVAYGLLRHFSHRNKLMRVSGTVMIATFLVMCVWFVRVFNLENELINLDTRIVGGASRLELILVLVLIFGSIFATLSLFYKSSKADEFLVMSSYSKKVQYRGEWITIEQYLWRELGIQISHGITPDEKDRMIEEWKQANP